MFEGLESADKDPRKSLHVDDVATPELAPDEAYIAVMASSINFNTVWTSIFEPLPTFGFLDRLGKESAWGARHALPYHVVGSDASGVVLQGRLGGAQLEARRPGHRALQLRRRPGPVARTTTRCSPANQRIWGFETNFGGLADLAVVKANQLMPKPAHLTWEEAASTRCATRRATACSCRTNGARMKQGDAVLVWGATGGLGGYAVQYVLNGGGTPVGVVSSPEKVELLHELGCEAVIDRKAAGYQFWKDEHTQDEGEWRRLGKDIRALVGEDPDIVFEHPGRQTMGASVFVCARGGTSSRARRRRGYMIEYDNRHLWMKLKRSVVALRQLPRGVGRQPARSPRARSSRSCRPCIRSTRSARRPTRSTTTSTRARSACCASPRRRASASTTPRSASRSARTRSPCSGGFDEPAHGAESE